MKVLKKIRKLLDILTIIRSPIFSTNGSASLITLTALKPKEHSSFAIFFLLLAFQASRIQYTDDP